MFWVAVSTSVAAPLHVFFFFLAFCTNSAQWAGFPSMCESHGATKAGFKGNCPPQCNQCTRNIKDPPFSLGLCSTDAKAIMPSVEKYLANERIALRDDGFEQEFFGSELKNQTRKPEEATELVLNVFERLREDQPGKVRIPCKCTHPNKIIRFNPSTM